MPVGATQANESGGLVPEKKTVMDRRTVMMGFAIAGSGALTAAAAQSRVENPLIAAFAKTLSAHDIDGFAALFAEDYVNHQMSAAVPKPEPGVSAKQATVGFFAARLKGIPDLSVAIEVSLAGDDMAAASFVYTGNHRGEYFGVPRPENPCTSHHAIFSAFLTARSRIIGEWAILPARSPN